MARPALLIGLGGTGQWVLTYVKKELLDYTKGEGMPEEVKLVAFDTARPIDEKKRRSGDEEPIALDGVKLGVGEFHHLGGNIERTVREIAEDQKHPHLGSWLQARTYLARLSAGQYVLEEGAGQMRPFGRMAVFKGLEANPQTSRIFGTLEDSINAIRSRVKEDRNLEISIVASLAGGTGAGMAIDVAHLARVIAERTIGSQKFVLRGFFVLPRAFRRVPGGDGQDMRARAFAAIRESLSRFLTVFGDRKYPMVYNPQAAFRDDLQKPVEKRLFELCYLIDPQRERNSLDAVNPRHGIFPSIADALLAFLDEKSGQAHTEHVQNVLRLLVKPDPEMGTDRAFFSALGTFSYTLPIREIAEENACRLAREFFNKLLHPVFDEEGAPIGLASDHNRELPGKEGREVADAFLANPGSVEGVRGTLFLPEVVRTLDSGGARNETLVRQQASRSNRDWLDMLSPDEASEEFRDLRYEVRRILEDRLRARVKSSKEELKRKPEADVERIEDDVESYRAENLGREQADGSTSGGRFREALARYEEYQVERFRRGLGEHVVALLNGASRTDPVLAREGKLGFVDGFLERLAKRLEGYCGFLGAVNGVRAEEGRGKLQREQVQAARTRMQEDRKKVGLFTKAGHRAQAEYLEVVEELIELEKDELVFATVVRVADQLRDEAIALRGRVRDWIRVLALGGEHGPGVYQALADTASQVKAQREKNRFFAPVRREETDADFEKALYARFAGERLDEMFAELHWTAEEGGEIGLEFGGRPLLRLRVRERDRPVRDNLRLILDETRRSFQSLVESESVARRLHTKHDAEDVARELYENGSPLYAEKERPPFGQPANFLTVRHDHFEGGAEYFQRVIGSLSGHSGARGQQAQLVGSEGSHKCTLVYTMDVLNADAMTAYHDLYEAYRGYADDRRLLHNFPAEVNAVYYEQRLQEKLNQPYRTLSPRIVFMLEHRPWVRQFVRSLMHGMVDVETDDERNPYWRLVLPPCEHAGRSFDESAVELTEHAAGGRVSVLDAMDTFVFRRKDVRKEWEIPIDEEHLAAALVDAENEIGDDGANIEHIQGFLKSERVKALKGSNKVFERDLGDLMHLILLDEIDRFSVR